MAFTVGCRTPEPPARRDETPAHQPEVTPLARAGGVEIHLPELSRAVEHARMLQPDGQVQFGWPCEMGFALSR